MFVFVCLCFFFFLSVSFPPSPPQAVVERRATNCTSSWIHSLLCSAHEHCFVAFSVAFCCLCGCHCCLCCGACCLYLSAAAHCWCNPKTQLPRVPPPPHARRLRFSLVCVCACAYTVVCGTFGFFSLENYLFFCSFLPSFFPFFLPSSFAPWIPKPAVSCVCCFVLCCVVLCCRTSYYDKDSFSPTSPFAFSASRHGDLSVYLFFENKEKKQPKNKRPFAIAFIVAPVLLLCLGANFIRHCLE